MVSTTYGMCSPATQHRAIPPTAADPHLYTLAAPSAIESRSLAHDNDVVLRPRAARGATALAGLVLFGWFSPPAAARPTRRPPRRRRPPAIHERHDRAAGSGGSSLSKLGSAAPRRSRRRRRRPSRPSTRSRASGSTQTVTIEQVPPKSLFSSSRRQRHQHGDDVLLLLQRQRHQHTCYSAGTSNPLAVAGGDLQPGHRLTGLKAAQTGSGRPRRRLQRVVLDGGPTPARAPPAPTSPRPAMNVKYCVTGRASSPTPAPTRAASPSPATRRPLRPATSPSRPAPPW